MKILIATFTLAMFCATASAQSVPQVIHLWENGAPGFENRKDIPEQAQDYWVRNVNDPLDHRLSSAQRKVQRYGSHHRAPGGGFRELVFNAEGIQAAQFLNSIGVAAFALKSSLARRAQLALHQRKRPSGRLSRHATGPQPRH